MSLRRATERLEISPLAAPDILDFVAYRRLDEVARYQSWPSDYSLDDAESLGAAQPRSGIPAPARVGGPPTERVIIGAARVTGVSL